MTDELLVLGSAAGIPTERRFSTAYALRVTGQLFLVDCGAPVSTLLYRYDLDPLDVHAIFLSHWHMDHVANLGLLLAQNHQLKRPKKLKIYGPRGTRGKINRLLADSFQLSDELRYDLKVKNIKTGKSYKEGLLRVTFFKTRHLEKPALKTHFGRKATACGMILKGPGWQVVYSGDVTTPQELSPYVKNCDLLIHEMAHVTPEAVADFAETAKIPHVLISHLHHKYDEAPEKIAAAFKGRYSGDLIVAEDGSKIRLSNIRKKTTAKVIVSKATQQVTKPPVQPAKSQQEGRIAFLNALQEKLQLPEETVDQVWQAAQDTLFAAPDTPPGVIVKPGQVKITIGRLQQTSQTEPDDIDVVVTLDGGKEDTAFRKKEGPTGLRRYRLVRVCEEAQEQNAIFTQHQLARLLNVSVRTIRRDLQALRADGYVIQTRGQL